MTNILGRGAEGSWGDEQWLISRPAPVVEERRSQEVPSGTLMVEEALARWQRAGKAVLPSYHQTVALYGEEAVEYIARRALAIARSSNNLARKTRNRGRLPALQKVVAKVSLPLEEVG